MEDWAMLIGDGTSADLSDSGWDVCYSALGAAEDGVVEW